MLNPMQPLFHIFSKDINDLYTMHAVRNLALSMVAIFIPIYLLKVGFGWIHIALYILLHYVFANVCSYYAFKLAAKIGVKRSFILSIPLKIAFLVGLEFAIPLQSFFGDYLAIAILAFGISLADSIYWMAYHVEFVRFSSEEKTAAQLGVGQIINAIAHSIAPFIGALIIVKLSFTTTFLVIGVLLLIGMIPILFTKDDHEPFHFNLKSLRHKNALRYMAEGMYSPSTSALWPLLLFTLYTSITTTGLYYVVSNTAYILMTYIVSHVLTNKNQAKLLLAGTLSHGASLVVRVLSGSPIGALIGQTYGGLSGPWYNITFHNIFYKQAKREDKAKHIYLREFYLNCGRCITSALLLVLFIFVSPVLALQITIIFAAVALQGLNWVKK